MESPKQAAATVGKKNKLGKSKLKKTIKNVICRPDHDFWPALNEEQSKELSNLICKYKVEIPETSKLHWSVLKKMPKSERPKVKRARNIPGFIFGLSQCERLIKSGDCSGVIIDGEVSPRILVTHIIDAASDRKVPVICSAGLKTVTARSFGFPSCCFALMKSDFHGDIKEKVLQLWKLFADSQDTNKNVCEKMEIQQPASIQNVTELEIDFKYLTRTSNTYRVFVPPTSDRKVEGRKDFSGQNYIKLGVNVAKDFVKKPMYKGMILKRVSSNPDRKKNKKT